MRVTQTKTRTDRVLFTRADHREFGVLHFVSSVPETGTSLDSPYLDFKGGFFFPQSLRRQCDPVRPGVPGFKTRSDHWSAALVNSQLACLRPVGMLNSCCCSVLS